MSTTICLACSRLQEVPHGQRLPHPFLHRCCNSGTTGFECYECLVCKTVQSYAPPPMDEWRLGCPEATGEAMSARTGPRGAP